MVEIKFLLETQPLFSLFLTIALGYLVGEINIKGFSLGSGAVLFVGLAQWDCYCFSTVSAFNTAPSFFVA